MRSKENHTDKKRWAQRVCKRAIRQCGKTKLKQFNRKRKDRLMEMTETRTDEWQRGCVACRATLRSSSEWVPQTAESVSQES